MKLIKINLLFLLLHPIIGQADISWESFSENIIFYTPQEETVAIFLQKSNQPNTTIAAFKEEVGDAMLNEVCQKTLLNIVKENIIKILETYNGQILFEKISTLLKQYQKIRFSSSADGVSINQLDFNLDPFHLYSSTDFYLIDGTIEHTSRPDVYFFHEFVHLYHYLADEFTSEETTNTFYSELESEFKEHFPGEDADGGSILDFEELKTITGIPFSDEEKIGKSILCENSYRQEKGFLLRLNLLDGNAKNLKTEIFKAKNFYLRPE